MSWKNEIDDVVDDTRNTMKILHFIYGTLNPNTCNGVNHVVDGLVREQVRLGHDVIVIGMSKGKKPCVVERNGYVVFVYPHFISAFSNKLKKVLPNINIVHFHGVWNIWNIFLSKYLLKKQVPYVITTHSGLTEDRIRQSRFLLKLVFHRLFQRRYMNQAAGIHAISREEMLLLTKQVENANLFYIPNAVSEQKTNLRQRKKQKKIRCCYLGRFGQEKNVSDLLKAIQLLPSEIKNNIECLLVGPIDKDAIKLKRWVEKEKLSHHVTFCGALFGAEKFQLLSKVDFYIHPALSDVVSIAVMEAFSMGLPAVITRTSQVSYFYNSGAFIMVEPFPLDIARGIIMMVDHRDQWKKMSEKAIKLVETVFNWGVSAKKMVGEYAKIIQQ